MAYQSKHNENTVIDILAAVSPCEQDYGEECDGDIGGGGSFVLAKMKGNSAV